MVDAGNFKGLAEIEHLRAQIKSDLDRFIDFVQRNGYYAECFLFDRCRRLSKKLPRLP